MFNNTGTILLLLLVLEYNTGIFLYTSIVHNTSIPVLWLPSTGDPRAEKGHIMLKLDIQNTSTCFC